MESFITSLPVQIIFASTVSLIIGYILARARIQVRTKWFVLGNFDPLNYETEFKKFFAEDRECREFAQNADRDCAIQCVRRIEALDLTEEQFIRVELIVYRNHFVYDFLQYLEPDKLVKMRSKEAKISIEEAYKVIAIVADCTMTAAQQKITFYTDKINESKEKIIADILAERLKSNQRYVDLMTPWLEARKEYLTTTVIMNDDKQEAKV